MNVDTTFTDSTVVAGTTYFYVVTAVDGSGTESAYSNEAKAVVPSP
jgi:fibronectin type 3 domain-containing protein